MLCSQGYFTSRNCMREIRHAVRLNKPIIAMLEPEQAKGGMTLEQIQEQLLDSDSRLAGWGFDEADSLRGEQLYAALMAHDPIEFARIKPFQDVALRMVSERLLPEGHDAVSVQGELTHLRPMVPPVATGFETHVYCSALNPGAREVIDELLTFQPQLGGQEKSKAQKLAGAVPLEVTSDPARQAQAEHMMVYLNGRTWVRGAESAAFVAEVAAALRRGTHLLLVHEMGQDRQGVPFAVFFEPDQTPPALIKAGIYAQIAIALKGVQEYRKVSFVLLAQALEQGIPDDTMPVTAPELVQRLLDLETGAGAKSDSLPDAKEEQQSIPPTGHGDGQTELFREQSAERKLRKEEAMNSVRARVSQRQEQLKAGDKPSASPSTQADDAGSLHA